MLNLKRALFPLTILTCLAAACSSGGGATDGGDGGGFTDICNTYIDGGPTVQNDGECQLDVVMAPAGDAGLPGQQFYMDHQGKTLWLWIQLPATVPSGELFHLVAGYSTPSEPVDLSILLLNSPTGHAVGQYTAVNNNATGKPGLIDTEFALTQYTPPGSIMWAEITDAADSMGDPQHPFNIYIDLVQNNFSSMGSPISFGALTGGIQTGSCPALDAGACQGVLALSGQMDNWTFNVPQSGGRQILYLDLSEPVITPAANYLLAYQVSNDAGLVINSGYVPNQFTAPDLQAALLVDPPGGSYSIQVFGAPLDSTGATYDPMGPADTRLTYTLNTELLPDLDTYEPNDTYAQALGTPAANIMFSAPGGGATNLDGRLSYFGDRNLYLLHFPASSGPTRLHYKMTEPTTGSRFPNGAINNPPNSPPDRLLNLYFDITGAGAAGTCLGNRGVCPADPEYIDAFIPDSGTALYQSQLLDDYCVNGDGDGGAFCVLSGREEFAANSEGFSPLQNFEGIIPLLGNGAQDIWLDLAASGGQFADDIPYTIALTWEAMDNPLSSQANPLQFGTLGASTTTVNGGIQVGFGYLNKYNLSETPPVDVRGQNDYDAIPSTYDVWEVGIPAGFQAAQYGATWGLGWSLSNPNGGMPAENLELGLTFCDANGTCTDQPPSRNGFPGALFYDPNADLPWYDPGGSGIYYPIASFAKDWITSPIAGGESITASPSSCTCIEAKFLPAGHFYVAVAGMDRTAWIDTNYTLSMSISNYPQSTGINNDAGVDVECPIGKPQGGDAGGREDGGPGCEFLDGF